METTYNYQTQHDAANELAALTAQAQIMGYHIDAAIVALSAYGPWVVREYACVKLAKVVA